MNSAEPLAWLNCHNRWPCYDPVFNFYSWIRFTPGEVEQTPYCLPREVFAELQTISRCAKVSADYPSRQAAEMDFFQAYWKARAKGWDPDPYAGMKRRREPCPV
jgi:hypothetical protein